MKFLLLISLFAVLVATCRAAVARGSFLDPNHPGKCVIKGLVLSPGEEGQDPTSCAKIFCGEKSFAELHTCGSVQPPPRHKLGQPISPFAPYPECCEKEFIRID